MRRLSRRLRRLGLGLGRQSPDRAEHHVVQVEGEVVTDGERTRRLEVELEVLEESRYAESDLRESQPCSEASSGSRPEGQPREPVRCSAVDGIVDPPSRIEVLRGRSPLRRIPPEVPRAEAEGVPGFHRVPQRKVLLLVVVDPEGSGSGGRPSDEGNRWVQPEDLPGDRDRNRHRRSDLLEGDVPAGVGGDRFLSRLPEPPVVVVAAAARTSLMIMEEVDRGGRRRRRRVAPGDHHVEEDRTDVRVALQLLDQNAEEVRPVSFRLGVRSLRPSGLDDLRDERSEVR
mmetsp:Transcript_18574/g.42930  ORF Transcript_18574/g.42930 Transcript_18574/m.42930 type:complete len:286 (+) Transcript_18574:28-885(+)